MLPAADHAGPTTGSATEPQPEPTPVPIRPLRFRELMDLPFELVQRRIKLLAALCGAGAAVSAAVAIGCALVVIALAGDSDAAVAVGAVLITLVCLWFLRLYVRGVTTVVAVAEVHRQPPGWRGALRRLLPHLPALALFQLKYTLIGIGVLALGVPLVITLPFAVIWLGWLRARQYTTAPVIVGESATAAVAAQRAKTLAQGTEWQLVGVWMALRTLLPVLLLPMLLALELVAEFTGTHRPAVIALIISVVMLWTAFADTIESATQTVVYVDRRCRREGWDIRIPRHATAMGNGAPP
ncbi:hypothetical protein IU501_23345 [Nocardia otitidiscaviarum]|uniref:hypothetical protein n=1 Tax=Nocardia otitidiscaviarum TaxID=1823 RepID=UPI0018942184|nr:hypothetical protein [Nocardia otitidiscaviarum]MBF6135931.1 hypothetical protein [Nocardia otitidiscaviarum]